MHVHRKEMYIHESKCVFLKKVFAIRERPFNLKGGGALCVTKFFILSLVLSEKKILNETKNHNPPPTSS